MTRLRFECWTHPGSGTFAKRFDVHRALPGSSGSRQLSTYSDESLELPANDPDIDQIISGAAGGWIKVFAGPYLIDEFEPQRVVVPSDRANARAITGPQRNSLPEGIATLPKGYPDYTEGAMHWVWGGANALPPFDLGDLNSIREVWSLYISGERYTLDLSSATGGDFTLTSTTTTSAIGYQPTPGEIKGALEALASITEVSVWQPDETAYVFTIVFETPKDLGSNMTANFGGLSGSATLTKLNDGFDTGDPLTFTLTVDGDTTEALDWDVSANGLEGISETLSPPGSGLQGLTTVDDVAVSGSGTGGDPWVITFYAPPNPSSVTINTTGLSGATAVLTQEIAGGLDPSPITISRPVDAGTGNDEQHGTYATTPIEVVTTPLDTGATWTLLVNALTRYAGSQIVLNVTPGRTYSDIAVPVYPTITGDYTLVIRDTYGNLITQTTPRNNTLTSGSYTNLTIDTLTIPDGVYQIIVRVAVTDADPANIGDFYVSWQTATFPEGDPAATFTQIVRELLEAGQLRGAGTFLELDASDAADTAGTTLTAISFTAWTGEEAHLGQVLHDGNKMGYRWRVLPAADAQIITPAGTTTHVIQIYYTTAGTIEDLTAGGIGPSITGGSKVPDATAITRRAPFTTLIALGAGALSAEQTNATTEAVLGRIERLLDAEHLASADSLADFLTTGHAEEAANRTAASATVLGTDTSLPLVAYTEGSKIWWQFPESLTKQARTVRSVSWVHRADAAEFQIEGSRVLTQDGGIAEAVDYLIRQLKRRRRGPQEFQPVQAAGRGGYPRITIAPADSSPRSREKADVDYLADSSSDADMFTRALEAMTSPGGVGGEIHITEGSFGISGYVGTVPYNTAITGMGIGITLIQIDYDVIDLTVLGSSSWRHLEMLETGG